MRILAIDDDELLLEAIRITLASKGHLIEGCPSGREALEVFGRRSPDAVLLDLHMPGIDGLGVLQRIRELDDEVPVLVMTAYGATDTALQAQRLGAFAYLSKPLNFDEVELRLEQARREHLVRHELGHLRKDQGRYADVVGSSPAMRTVFQQLQRIEQVEVPTVLLQGESGTGKDLIARAIHARGPRRNRPFMEVDCAALPDGLIESELFGHEKGAFTDASRSKPGLFEVAADGTLFLDEVGELPLTTQAKLLRALEGREFKRVGGLVPIALQAAIVAATNRDLEVMVREGRFREDLYFRLAVVPISIPPLRDRLEDLPELCEAILARLNRELGRAVEGLTHQAMLTLQRYSWPGNVRELRNLLERIVILTTSGALIQESELPIEVRFHEPSEPDAPPPKNDGDDEPDLAAAKVDEADPPPSELDGSQARAAGLELPVGGVDLAKLEMSFIRQALKRTGGNKTEAAQLLGLTRHALRYRLEKMKDGETER